MGIKPVSVNEVVEAFFLLTVIKSSGYDEINQERLESEGIFVYMMKIVKLTSISNTSKQVIILNWAS